MRRYQFTCHLFLRRRSPWKTLRGILRPFKKIFEITYCKLQRFDASHIVTNRSGDILVLITISMGKEKSQFSKILIESLHRWNRSRISMTAAYLTMSGTVARAAQTVTESSRLGDYYQFENSESSNSFSDRDRQTRNPSPRLSSDPIHGRKRKLSGSTT